MIGRTKTKNGEDVLTNLIAKVKKRNEMEGWTKVDLENGVEREMEKLRQRAFTIDTILFLPHPLSSLFKF